MRTMRLGCDSHCGSDVTRHHEQDRRRLVRSHRPRAQPSWSQSERSSTFGSSALPKTQPSGRCNAMLVPRSTNSSPCSSAYSQSNRRPLP